MPCNLAPRYWCVGGTWCCCHLQIRWSGCAGKLVTNIREDRACGWEQTTSIPSNFWHMTYSSTSWQWVIPACCSHTVKYMVSLRRRVQLLDTTLSALNVTEKTWKIQVLWGLMLCQWASGSHHFEGSWCLQNTELLTHWQITFHKTWMFGNITMRTSNLARKTLSLQNMKVELCGQESPPLYTDHIKSFASRLYFNKFYYISPGCVWGCCSIFHPGMDTSLLTCSGHMTFSKALLNGHYCCFAYGREDAVV